MSKETLEKRIERLERITDTQMLDEDFWKRASAVWGHAMAIGAVISVGIFILAFIIGS